MIVVDSSVWIAYLRDADSPAVSKLRSLRSIDEILVGDIVLLEILQGARDDRHAETIERSLRAFETRPMLDDRLAVKCAANYRRLRSSGITIRKTIDMIIATYCIEHNHALLHDDRDFDLMTETLGLNVL